ncbi:MAG: methyltransferase domain-containing protein [Verrucomicrobiota bacterium]|jgi:tRNA1(Val) A37 N6-methylase TrmN6
MIKKLNKGLGQYDQEYAACHCFWGRQPAKYIRLLVKHLSEGRILDLGAGEGKNSLFLAERGFHIVAVECSQYAIANFKRRLREVAPSVRNRIQIVATDDHVFSK